MPEETQSEQQEVWSNTLDGKYDVKVTRTERGGHLTISEGDDVLYEQDVSLAYGAMFGPDVSDVQQWEEIAVRFADSREKPTSS